MPSKNVVVFIHGIGKHEAGWANAPGGPIETLKKSAARYPDVFPDTNPIDKSVEFVEIAYDDIFEKIRQQWHDLAKILKEASFDGASQSSVEALQAFMPGAIADLESVTGETKWAATHALDAILYKGFLLVRNIVRYSVASQLANIVAERIQADRDDDPSYTIVAHSLGTAVLHDAVNLLAGTNWLNGVAKLKAEGLAANIDDAKLKMAKDRFGANPFSSKGLWAWNGIVMISNVSAILCRRPAPDSPETRTRPMHSGGQNGRATDYYINIDHLFDPIAKLKPFRAEATWPTSRLEGFAFDLVSLKHFYDKNVHGLSHYLIHPSVHSRIFWLATPKRFRFSHVRAADEGVGSLFPNLDPKFADDAKRKALEKALDEIFDLTDPKEIEAYRKRVEALADIIKGA